MNIDLGKNGEEIYKAYNDVLDDKSDTNWALYAYEGQTNILRLAGTGDCGLEELAEDLNSSKIMYAIVKVIDPKTTRNKIILIDWQGEGAPLLRKGQCARHVNEIARIFKAHITINARTEEEVETDAIMEAVAKSTITSYNFNDRSQIMDRNAPVGTNYKRTNPLSEINTSVRSKFWEEQEEEEKKRKQIEVKRREEELLAIEKLRLEREMNDAKHREALAKERNARIVSEKKAEAQADKNLSNLNKDEDWQRELQRQQQEEKERAQRAEQMRTERKKEAQSLIGQKTHTFRDMFESKTTAVGNQPINDKNRPPPRKLKEFHPVNQEDSTDSTPASLSSSSPQPSRRIGARWPPVEPEPRAADPVPKPGKIYNREMVPDVVSDVKQSIDKPKTKSNYAQFIEHKQAAASSIHQSQTKEFINKQSTTVNKHQISSQESSYRPVSTQQSFTKEISNKQASLENRHTNINQEAPNKQTSYLHQDSSNKVKELPNTSNSHRQDIEDIAQKHSVTSNIFKSNGLPKNQINGSENLPIAVTPLSMSPKKMNSQTTNGSTHESIKINDTPSSPLSEHVPQVKEQHSHIDNRYDTVHSPESSRNYYDTPENVVNGEPDVYTTITCNSMAMTYEIDGIEYQILQEHGLCARALYDYQAADETEITFDPGQIITNIEQIDSGWWQGIGPNGTFGLFPANYVELINAVA